MNPTIAVIGLGYIGLPTATALAAPGTRVHGVDVNPRTVDMVNRGELPFVEPGLERAHRRGPGDVGQKDDRPLAAAHSLVVAAVEDAQLISPCSAPGPPRSSGPTGWRVEMACL